MTNNMDRVVLAFSGGAQAADAIRALSATRTVVTVTLDVGQGYELTGLRERALASGAVRAHVLDVREELARDYFWPAVQEGRSVVFRAGELLAPLVASKLVEVAAIEDAAFVAHEWSGEDANRLAAAVTHLAPELTVLAPLRTTGLSAADEPTLWSSGRLSGDAFELTRNAADAPLEGASIEISFEGGSPRRLNGVEMNLVETIESLETLAGAHGVGRVRLSDGSWVEAPAAIVVELACDALRAAASPGDAPLDGTVSMRLQQGACSIVSCSTGEPRLAGTSAERR